MYFKRFFDEDLAHASYLVGCQASGEAIVVDPSRRVTPYLDEASKQGLVISKITETHIHADFLSGSRQLAMESGARLLLSGEGGEGWQYQFLGTNDRKIFDGDEIEVGNLTLRVMHTPGHTPEHLTFVLTNHSAGNTPVGAFTGDFVFVGDVGRPDLLEKAAGEQDTMDKSARQLYRSLQKFGRLPDHLQIWPAHGAGSACGKAPGALPTSVLRYEKLTSWAFQPRSEEQFVKTLLEGQPEPPRYFAKMKEWNRCGPAYLPEEVPDRLSAHRLAEIGSKRLLVDLRGEEAFAQGHPENAIFLPDGNPLPTWAGWLLAYDEPHYLILKSEDGLDRVLRALRSVGLDQTAGYFLETDVDKLHSLVSSERILPAEVDPFNQDILDVRSESEWQDGHLKGARHIYLGDLADHLDEVPDRTVVHCQSGTRSLIASSLLQRAGKSPRDVVGGFAEIESLKETLCGSG